MGISTDHIVANGPEGLEKVLGDLLAKTKDSDHFAKQEHYILYQLGSQKSLIKVDTKQVPFKFWHFDLMGRPATVAIKETIARFIWDKCGVKELAAQQDISEDT